jgi:hypothetical protein
VSFARQSQCAQGSETHVHYFRFDCENGLGDIKLDRVDQLSYIARLTDDYLSGADVQADIIQCATVLASMLEPLV